MKCILYFVSYSHCSFGSPPHASDQWKPAACVAPGQQGRCCRAGTQCKRTPALRQTWSHSPNPSRPSAASKLNYYPRNETENHLIRMSVFKKRTSQACAGHSAARSSSRDRAIVTDCCVTVSRLCGFHTSQIQTRDTTAKS